MNSHFLPGQFHKDWLYLSIVSAFICFWISCLLTDGALCVLFQSDTEMQKVLSGFPHSAQGTFDVASTLFTTSAFLELTASYVVCQFLNLLPCWSRVQ